MNNDLYAAETAFVYRIYDPIENKFCNSGTGLYAKKRSVWVKKSGASIALQSMPEEIRERLVIKKFILEEV